MKTLIYTSIYSNLWGSEFGGRPSRGLHYKYSLLSILDLNATKFVCFTSEEEIDDLKHWFYHINKISEDKLELIPFDLKSSRYFNDIRKLKNLEEIKKSDRCYEIQYNKFFWLDEIKDIQDYDKVYWFDAGLSHGGLIPEQYSYGAGLEKHFSFTVFNENYLNYLNDLTNDKILIVSKNNSGRFYWSPTIPIKYYNEYSNSEHIIGGFFGGNLNLMLEFKNMFETTLIELLDNEKELYHEELIMSNLYFNNVEFFITFKFDDWYVRDTDNPEENIKYFYEIFNMNSVVNVCICSSVVEIGDGDRYLNSSKKLIDTYLKYTNFDIIITTNKPDFYKDYTNLRLKIINLDDINTEPITSYGRFNMHLKRLPIRVSQELGYQVIYYHDCDCYIEGWDSGSFIKKCETDFDVAFVSHANPQLGGLRKSYEHFQKKIDLEFGDLYYDELDDSPNPAETRVIFKNNDKLTKFLDFWDLISSKNENFDTYHDGVYFGTSAKHSGMNMIGVTKEDNFTKYCRIQHGDGTLDYFGTKIMNTTISESNFNIPSINNNTENNVRGAFNYKGLQMLQHSNIVDNFKRLLSEIKPKKIIEIGTEYGGLTLLLQDLILELELDTKIRTYDIKDPKFLISHEELTSTIEIVNKDLFLYNPFRLSDDSKKEIKDFLSSDGYNIILCDGGNKINEFNVFSELINEGDIIMLHDYIKDTETFNEKFLNKIWNWHESDYSSIQDSVIKHSLIPFQHEEFSEVVWGVFRKENTI